jgi:hypothetical protein
MFFWFIGAGIACAWNVLRDPALDYRILVLGLLLPDLVDGVLGNAGAAHSVVGSVVVLVVIMLVTIGRRHLRRRLLALPIGMMTHLVLDGAWAVEGAIGWPFFGVDGADTQIPSFERPLWLTLSMEVVGLGCLVWFARRFGLVGRNAESAARRRQLLRDGRLDRTLTR